MVLYGTDRPDENLAIMATNMDILNVIMDIGMEFITMAVAIMHQENNNEVRKKIIDTIIAVVSQPPKTILKDPNS